jgi:hypothetical protein
MAIDSKHAELIHLTTLQGLDDGVITCCCEASHRTRSSRQRPIPAESGCLGATSARARTGTEGNAVRYLRTDPEH